MWAVLIGDKDAQIFSRAGVEAFYCVIVSVADVKRVRIGGRGHRNRKAESCTKTNLLMLTFLVVRINWGHCIENFVVGSERRGFGHDVLDIAAGGTQR